MFELEIKVTNGRYAGITEVYEQQEPLLKFSKQLLDYPTEETISHSCGEKDSYAYFKMKFYPIGFKLGKFGVHISLEENVPTVYRQEEKDKLNMELIVEQSAIDVFQKELFSLAQSQKGSATLIGI